MKWETMSSTVPQMQMQIWFKANGIIHEKTELFHDFILSLFELIESTYMGDDVTGPEDKEKHFEWCWSKTIDNFEYEKVFFERQGQHKEYFRSFFDDSFYHEEEKEDTIRVKNFISAVFNITNRKTKSELDMFGDLYKLLERSLKKVY